MPDSSRDLASLPLIELLALRNAIEEEVATRGYARTRSSLVGEISERVVANAYEGELCQTGERSIDVVASDGRGIQVKARSLPRGDLRHWAFHDLEFDAAVVICFDRESSELLWAREISSSEIATLARPHQTDNWRLRMAVARDAGLDVSQKLRIAYSTLL